MIEISHELVNMIFNGDKRTLISENLEIGKNYKIKDESSGKIEGEILVLSKNKEYIFSDEDSWNYSFLIQRSEREEQLLRVRLEKLGYFG